VSFCVYWMQKGGLSKRAIWSHLRGGYVCEIWESENLIESFVVGNFLYSNLRYSNSGYCNKEVSCRMRGVEYAPCNTRFYDTWVSGAGIRS
jgi:hypothetical protein